MIFDSKLTFTEHYSAILRSALKTLGFVIRTTKKFKNNNAVKVLYETLIHPKLKYAALVWPLTYNKNMKELEKVQRRFLKYLSWKKYGTYSSQSADYFSLCADLNMLTLEEGKNIVAVLFIINLLEGHIDCPRFLGMILLHAPVSMPRTPLPFYIPTARTNFTKSSPLHRLLSICNYTSQNSDQVDIIDSNHSLNTSVLRSISVQLRNNVN